MPNTQSIISRVNSLKKSKGDTITSLVHTTWLLLNIASDLMAKTEIFIVFVDLSINYMSVDIMIDFGTLADLLQNRNIHLTY